MDIDMRILLEIFIIQELYFVLLYYSFEGLSPFIYLWNEILMTTFIFEELQHLGWIEDDPTGVLL